MKRSALAVTLVLAGCSAHPAPPPTDLLRPTPGARTATAPPLPQPGTLSNCRQLGKTPLTCSNISLRILHGKGTYTFPGKHTAPPFVSLTFGPQSNPQDVYVFHSISASAVTVWAVRSNNGQLLPSHSGAVSLVIVTPPGS